MIKSALAICNCHYAITGLMMLHSILVEMDAWYCDAIKK
jgi:hypothetical protein